MKFVRNLPFSTAVFLVFAFLFTLGCGLLLVVGKQIYRQSANDPQIQISEDMASFLGEGKDAKELMPPRDTDIAKSQVWFMMVFDDGGQVVASNAKIDGQDPELPQGVLDHAKKGQHKVIWEPKEGVRVASVITKYNGGSVLVGRSFKEAENRIMLLGKTVLIGWLAGMVVAFLGTWFLLPRRLH